MGRRDIVGRRLVCFREHLWVSQESFSLNNIGMRCRINPFSESIHSARGKIVRKIVGKNRDNGREYRERERERGKKRESR